MANDRVGGGRQVSGGGADSEEMFTSRCGPASAHMFDDAGSGDGDGIGNGFGTGSSTIGTGNGDGDGHDDGNATVACAVGRGK